MRTNTNNQRSLVFVKPQKDIGAPYILVTTNCTEKEAIRIMKQLIKENVNLAYSMYSVVASRKTRFSKYKYSFATTESLI